MTDRTDESDIRNAALELLPCPFCGGEAITCGDNEINPRHWVMCSKCHACPGGDVAKQADAIAAWNHRAFSLKPVAWLRKGSEEPVQGVPFGAMWITDGHDPFGFAVYAAPPNGLETAIAIIEARLPLYTDIGQINALRECIGSIRALKSDPAPVPAAKPFTFADPARQVEHERHRAESRREGE